MVRDCVGGGGLLGFVRYIFLSFSVCVVSIQRTAVEGCTSVESLSVLVAMVEGGVGIWSKRIEFGWQVEKWVLEGIFC